MTWRVTGILVAVVLSLSWGAGCYWPPAPVIRPIDPLPEDRARLVSELLPGVKVVGGYRLRELRPDRGVVVRFYEFDYEMGGRRARAVIPETGDSITLHPPQP